MGHSEGNVRPPFLFLTAAFLSSVLHPLSARIARSRETRGWIDALGSDLAAIVVVAGVVLLIAVLVCAGLAARARRQERRRRDAEQMTAASAGESAIARWVDEGRHLVNDWQERIERLGELQSRLAAMAEEIGQLRAQVSRMDAMQAENLHLVQENEALLREQDEIRGLFARIGELIQQASETRPRTTGETAGP